MSKVITSPESWDDSKEYSSVFLAGSMGEWRSEVMDALADEPIQFLDPTRDDYADLGDAALEEQILWERNGLESADLRVFVFEAGKVSPIGLMELGEFSANPSIVVAEPEFESRANVEILCEEADLLMLDSVEELIETLSEVAGDTLGEMKTAANYDDMFRQLIALDPTTEDKIKKEVTWAKANLKKSNRIVWYLRLMRLYFAEDSLKDWGGDENSLKQLESLIAKYKKELNITSDAFRGITPAQIKHQLAHLFALEFPDIQNYEPGYKPLNEVLRELAELEAKYIGTNEDKTLKPKDEDSIFLDCRGGWAWWLLPRSSCSDESKAMGHCGNGPAAGRTDMNILSLRQKVEKAGSNRWEPHLTFIFHHFGDDAQAGTLGEMKGKGNAKPVARYHPYIIQLLKDKRIKGIDGGGYMPQNNFSPDDLTPEQQKEVAKVNPDALLTLKQRIDKYGAEEFGLEGAFERFGENLCSDGIVVATYESPAYFVAEIGEVDMQRLADCSEGDFAFFGEYMINTVPEDRRDIFLALAHFIKLEQPDLAVNTDSLDIKKEVIQSLVDMNPDKESELHKRLSKAFLNSSKYQKVNTLEEYLKDEVIAAFEQIDVPDSELAPCEVTFDNEEVIIYIPFQTAITYDREFKDKPDLGEYYIPSIYSSFEDKGLSDWDDLLGNLETELGSPVRSLRQLERGGQERLFKRPETDEEAKREGIKHASANYEATPENIQSARTFLTKKWKERAAELGRPEPEDLSCACKFASLFAQGLFGGKIRGNKDHQYLLTDDGLRVDLTEGSVGSDNYEHDKSFMGNSEHRESMASCMPRVKQWLQEYRKENHVKVAMPDFGYSQFNDRDKDLKSVKFTTEMSENTLGVAARIGKGKAFAYMQCDDHDGEGRYIEVTAIDIPNEWRGTGLGQMMYDAAIQAAKKAGFSFFGSDATLSPDAVNAWKRLSKRYPVETDSREAYIGDSEERTDSYVIDLSKVTSKTASIFDPIPEPWRNSSYVRSIELVPIDELKPYMEYNRMLPSQAREEDPDEYIQELAESIKREGIREPLILEYSQNTGRALLTEGNHRILAAERAGLQDVPVRGYRRYGPFRGYHKGVIPPEKNFGTDALGNEYVPQDFKPSVLGIGGSKRGMSHDKDAE